MKQRFIISINEVTDGEYYNFFRVGCYSVKSTVKTLAEWINQANKDEDLKWLYRCFFKEGATYTIESTPDGCRPVKVVASGLCSELIE